MSELVADVLDALDAAHVPTALIGAAALALRGAPRSSQDTDLLVLGDEVFSDMPWADLVARGTSVALRRAEPGDPLAGVVRIERGVEQVDVVALRGAPWQRTLLVEATPMRFAGRTTRVCTACGLVLLKLYAGGHHDRQDVLALLALHGESLRVEVDARVHGLTADAVALWQELRTAP